MGLCLFSKTCLFDCSQIAVAGPWAQGLAYWTPGTLCSQPKAATSLGYHAGVAGCKGSDPFMAFFRAETFHSDIPLVQSSGT